MKSKNTTLISFIIMCCLFSFIQLNAQNKDQSVAKISIENLTYNAGEIVIQTNNQLQESFLAIVECNYRKSETDEEYYLFSKSVMIDVGYSSIKLKDAKFYEATIIIKNQMGQILDQANISDGKWIIHNSEDLFLCKIKEEERSAQNDKMTIDRSLVVVPRMYNKVYISRTFNTEETSVDLSSYTHLQFESKELEEIKITLVTKNDIFSMLASDLEDGYQVFDLKNAKNELGKSCDLNQVFRIDFEVDGYGLALPVQLINFEFITKSTPRERQALELYDASIYPNPSNGIINIEVEKPGVYQFQLYSNFKLMINEQLNITDITQLNLTHLPKGKYICKIFNQHTNYTDILILL